MLRRYILLLLALWACTGPGQAAVDLTASAVEYVGEGIKYRQLQFKDEQKVITIELPNGWSFRSAARRLQLIPPADKQLAEGTFEATPLPTPAVLDANALPALEQQVLAALPFGSQNPTVLSRLENTVLVNNNPTIEIVVSYQLNGRSFQRSVVVCNYQDTQLVFRFTAAKADFETLNRSFRRCVFSWQVIDPAAVAQKG